MPKLVVLITPQFEKGHEIAEAWQKNGAPGVTLTDGQGLFHLQETAQKSGVLPGLLSVLEILRSHPSNNIVLLSLVATPAVADKLIDIADQIIGGFSEPDNGLVFVVDVERVVGLRQWPD
jgi:hypothetical protein